MMKSTPLRVLVLTVAVAVAFVLGASSSATAGSLTKGAVKKIAAKVVKKKAGSLSVSHADTATNSSTLGGKTPSAYSDDTIRYALTGDSVSAAKRFALTGLTPGATYDVHFHLLLGEAPTTPSGTCYLEVAGSSTRYASGFGASSLNSVSFDGGAVVTAPSVGDVAVVCTLSIVVKTVADQPSFAEATPLDSVTSRAATTAP